MSGNLILERKRGNMNKWQIKWHLLALFFFTITRVYYFKTVLLALRVDMVIDQEVLKTFVIAVRAVMTVFRMG